MSPRKPPCSLFKMCVRSCLNLINECCFLIEKKYADIECRDCESQIISLKSYLMSSLPSRFVNCNENNDSSTCNRFFIIINFENTCSCD